MSLVLSLAYAMCSLYLSPSSVNVPPWWKMTTPVSGSASVIVQLLFVINLNRPLFAAGRACERPSADQVFRKFACLLIGRSGLTGGIPDCGLGRGKHR